MCILFSNNLGLYKFLPFLLNTISGFSPSSSMTWICTCACFKTAFNFSIACGSVLLFLCIVFLSSFCTESWAMVPTSFFFYCRSCPGGCFCCTGTELGALGAFTPPFFFKSQIMTLASSFFFFFKYWARYPGHLLFPVILNHIF